MSLKITFKGSKDFYDKLARISSSSQELATQAVMKGANIIRSEAVREIMRGARSGRTYRRGSITHQASAPGEFPKTDTGELVANITVRPEGRFAATVGSRAQAPQGYWLEVKPISMGGRPWLSRTVRLHGKKVMKLIEQSVAEAFRRG